MTKEKILITSALPYANGPLHFGHVAGAYLPGDCYARFQRLQGADVLYLCGSDEYGVAVTISAEMAKRSPKEHVDIYHEINKAFFEKLEFSFDHYSRTTWPGHVETVQQYFKDLLAGGYIEEKVTDQLYSIEDKRFLADRYVVGTCPKCGFDQARGDECQKCGASYESTDLKSPRSKISGSPLTLKPTKHWFLLFDKFKEQLKSWIEKKDWKPNVVNFAKGYIDELRPRAITRDSEWGVPIPLEGTEGKVFYVWFDAPIGYISAAKEWAEIIGEKDAWKGFWCSPDTKLVHFIGKDNIPFHAVFFPAMTMGQNQPYKLVDEVPANEFLNLEGRQFSKSDNWTIDFERFFLEFTPDQIRYCLAANAPETQDAEFTWKDFQMRCNSELLGKYGNLANRTLVFAQKHCAGKMPKIQNEDKEFRAKVEALVQKIKESYSTFHLRRATQEIMELATIGNVYFDAKKPWVLAKDPNTRQEMLDTIGMCIECLKALALVSSPIIPVAAQKLWQLIGFDTELAKQNWSHIMDEKITPETPFNEPEPLFKKVEDALIKKEEEELNRVLEDVEVAVEPPKEEIGFDTFLKMDLRVAQILDVEPVPKSKKLLKLTVDVGFAKRTIVSGIAQYYEDPQELVGKKVVVVANLKPAKLMGVESQGMIIVAGLEKGIEMLHLQNAQPGDQIS
ncbi:MAG: methionine--tRNA ligase [Simkaniaceae bacterium]|nr:methionine--tRNA ligase [Candidatus Sacchlamyda saccharinae]